MRMSQETIGVTLFSTILAVIIPPIQFVAVMVWLLLASTALELWSSVSEVRKKGVHTILETLTDVFWLFIKQLAVLFFLLTMATALSKFGPAIAWIEIAAYSGIGVWLFTVAGKNAAKLIANSGLEDVIKRIANRYLEESKKDHRGEQ